MPKKRLTDKAIQNLRIPASEREEYLDDTKWFVLRISHIGDKVWSVVCRVMGEGGLTETGRELRGKQKRISLGPYPAISLAEARCKAFEKTDRADRHIDPKIEKAQLVASRYNGTLEKVANTMVDLAETQTINAMRSAFKSHIFPIIGPRPMAEVRLADINILLGSYVATEPVTRESML